jgi:hypothetical protein
LDKVSEILVGGGCVRMSVEHQRSLEGEVLWAAAGRQRGTEAGDFVRGLKLVADGVQYGVQLAVRGHMRVPRLDRRASKRRVQDGMQLRELGDCDPREMCTEGIDNVGSVHVG